LHIGEENRLVRVLLVRHLN